MNKVKKLKPTEGELEILQVLWAEGEATVRKVHEALNTYKESGYTTTLKLMQIMLEKGLVNRDASSKTHIYSANITREGTQELMISKMVNSLFGGSATQLVMQALGSQTPGRQDLEEIQKLLNELKKD